MKSDLWITEQQTEDLLISFRVKEKLHEEKTDFQHLSLVDTYTYGRMLFLDHCVMTSIKEEFVYHEMITWVALNTHPCPQNVLIIGGGDGGALREVVKHPRVKSATLVEIDERVIINSQKYLPEIGSAFEHPKAKVLIADGIKHVQERQNEYNLIIIDSTDPIGPAEGLFSADFYQAVYQALREDGIMVAQTESPFLPKDRKLIKRIQADLRKIYSLVRLYLAYVPIYPTGMWSFSLASKKYDPLKVNKQEIIAPATRYYNSAIHHAAFVLPSFVQEFLQEVEKC